MNCHKKNIKKTAETRANSGKTFFKNVYKLSASCCNFALALSKRNVNVQKIISSSNSHTGIS